MFKCFTENTLLTERYFLEFEYAIKLENQDPSANIRQVLKSQSKILIASTNPELWVKTLMKLPRNSVIFFLLGNETYDPKTFNSLNQVKAVCHVFIYNAPTSIKLRNHLFAFFGDLLDTFAICEIKSLCGAISDLRASRGLHKKFRKILIQYPWSYFPQGYSAAFVEGLIEFGLRSNDCKDSLLNPEFHLNDNNVRRLLFISFVGQETNRRRRICIELVKREKNSNILLTKSFGGTTHTGDLSYIQSIFSSKFVAVPPGFFNNSNHRNFEAIIAGALPISLTNNSIDASNSNINWSSHLGPIVSRSFWLLLRFARNLSEQDRQERINVEKQRIWEEVQKSKAIFAELMR